LWLLDTLIALHDSRTTEYCYDGDQVIAEYEGTTLVRKFIYGPGIDEPICMIDVEDENAKYYYHYDALGSVVALSNSSGNIVETYSYDVFGEPSSTGSVGNPYFFTGRRLDAETGLYYYRFRYYKPEIGRFLQPDPMAMFMQLVSTQQHENLMLPGKYLPAHCIDKFLKTDPIGIFLRKEPGSRLAQATSCGFYIDLNLYTYCGNNPLVFIDPYGLGFWRDLWKAKGLIGYGMLGIGGAVVIVATSPAWITAGAVTAVGGIGLMAWDIIDKGKMLEHPPGEGAFRKHRQQLDELMDEIEGDECKRSP